MRTHLILSGRFYCQSPGMRLVTNEVEKVTCRRCLVAHEKGQPEIDYSDHASYDHDCVYDHNPSFPRYPVRTDLRIERLFG